MPENEKEIHETVYFVPDAFAKTSGVWLLKVGHNIAKPAYHVEPRVIEWYNIHFVMQGKVELTFDQNVILLNQGDAFCLFPGLKCGYRYRADEKPLKMIWISFDGIQSRSLLTKAGYKEEAPYVRQVMSDELHHALQQLFVPPHDGFKRFLELQFSLYRIFSFMTPAEESVAPSHGPAQWIPKSIDYMKTHYMERITIQDVSAHICVHRAHLSKVFTEKVGMTPARFLEKLRMEKAKELLRTSAYTIKEIASTIGYPDPYTFTHAFSRYCGVPPGKWRRTNVGGGPPER